MRMIGLICFFFQAEDGIRDIGVTGVQTCALSDLARGTYSSAPVRTPTRRPSRRCAKTWKRSRRSCAHARPDRRHPLLPDGDLAAHAAGLPLLSLVLAVRGGGDGEIRRPQGRLAPVAPAAALPPALPGRLRPGPVKGAGFF